MSLETDIKHRGLYVNVCFAIAVGTLNTVAKQMQTNSRQQGRCLRLAKYIEQEGWKLEAKSEKDKALLIKAIDASTKTFVEVCTPTNAVNVMLNLVSHCMDELDCILRYKHYENLRGIFGCFDGSDVYEDIKLGERVWTRLMSEVEILKAMEVYK